MGMPQHSARMPWSSFAWALLAAVCAHWMAWSLAKSRFHLSFDRPAQDTAFATRMIQPPSAALLPAAVTAPANSAAPAAAPVRANAARAQNATNPRVPENKEYEKNQPLARTESTQSAIENLASIKPEEESSTSPSAAPVGNVPEQLALQMSYPASAKLQFDGVFMSKGNAQSGNGLLSWSTDGGSYTLSLEATAFVIFGRTEKSEGAISSQGLAPMRYSSNRTGRSEQATHFLHETAKIKFSNNKPEQILLAGAQDRLSALLQLAGIIGGSPERYKAASRISMQVAGLDSAEMWEFNVQGFDEIKLAAADLQALKLSRTPRNEYDQQLEIWLAPQLGYLPVRIRQSSASAPDQDFTDLVLRKLP